MGQCRILQSCLSANWLNNAIPSKFQENVEDGCSGYYFPRQNAFETARIVAARGGLSAWWRSVLILHESEISQVSATGTPRAPRNPGKDSDRLM
jgi:hypothetical protein